MSYKRNGKSNNPNSMIENMDGPSREELITQLTQLRSSLEGAYETLECITTSDPDVTQKIGDMVVIINGLHECEFELMTLLAKDSQASPTPIRSDGAGASGGNDARSTSQEDLSRYGAYGVSSSRQPKTANDLTKRVADKVAEEMEAFESQMQFPILAQIPPQHRLDYMKRLQEIQKFQDRFVNRCRKLGLVVNRGFALDRNIASKMNEVKDIVATKELAQKNILELKALMQQVMEDKLDTEISLSKIENDESYGRPIRFESRLGSRGATSGSPHDELVHRNEDNIPKPTSASPSSLLHDSNYNRHGRSVLDRHTGSAASSDYAQFLRGLRQPFPREHGERESAFVPIHNHAHMDASREKNKSSSNIDAADEIKVPRATANASLLRRVIDGGVSQYPQNNQIDQHRHGRSSSARASLVPPPVGCNTMPSNVFRSNYNKTPPSMQSSSGIGSMNSRSMASLDNNGRNDLPPAYLPYNRIASRGGYDPEESLMQRSLADRANMSSNNLNKSYRQPTRSTSFYSELDLRNQEMFPSVPWEEDALNPRGSPIRLRSPDFRGSRRTLSAFESQQITDELHRMLRVRTSEEPTPSVHQNWWSNTNEVPRVDPRIAFMDHNYYNPRGRPSLQTEVTSTVADSQSQTAELQTSIQEMVDQIRALTCALAANKSAARDASMQHRFDIHNATRCIRDISDMVSESMKRFEGQLGSQTRLIMDLEARLRRMEDNQRLVNQKFESSSREREWQVPGRPDFMVSQDHGFQYGHESRDGISRERDGGQSSSGSMLNNQIPPGTRANNYWDNFRSYSRQNMLSKSNANVPQQYSHEPSPSAADGSRYTSSDTLNNSQAAAADLSAETSRRNGNANGKNLWATSGFYENMNKKRNKDQKPHVPLSSINKGSGNGNISAANCSSGVDHLFSSRGPQPEPDESRELLSSNRETLYSQLSPQSPNRRDTDSGPYSRLADFDVPWPWHQMSPSDGRFRRPTAPEASGAVMSPSDGRFRRPTAPEASGAVGGTEFSRQHRRDSIRDDERNPDSPNSSVQKVDKENFNPRSSSSADAVSNLDDSRSSDNMTEGIIDVEIIGPEDWGFNALDVVNAAASVPYGRSPSPILPHRHGMNDSETNSLGAPDSPDQRDTRTPTNVESPTSTTVGMNIRCEESAANGEDMGAAGNESRSSESTNNNNF